MVEPSSGRTDERSKRLQEANPYDRSLGDDNTERGRYPQPSREAFGRGDRPDVPQRLCTEVAARTRNCVVFPRASRTACAICGGDEPDDRAALPLDRTLDRDGQSLLRLRSRPRLRAVLPQVLQLLSLQCQAVPERPRIRQMPTRPARYCVRGARQWRPELRRPRAPAEDLRRPFGAKDRWPAAQVAALAAPSVHQRRSPSRLPLRRLDP